MSSGILTPQSVRLAFLVVLTLLTSQCSQRETPSPANPEHSDIQVNVNPSGQLIVTTSAAEFHVLPSGYIQAFLLKDGAKLTLDDQRASTTHEADHLVTNGKPIGFTPDFSKARVLDAQGKLGRGKRVEIPAASVRPNSL